MGQTYISKEKIVPVNEKKQNIYFFNLLLQTNTLTIATNHWDVEIYRNKSEKK